MAKDFQTNDAQIIRKDGRNTIFEVMNTPFGIEKVLVNFQKYDPTRPAGQKVTEKVGIYIGFAEWLRLTQEFAKSTVGFQKLELAEKKAKTEGKPFYGLTIAMGGTSYESMKRRGRERADGLPEYRALSIEKSSKINGYLLKAISGPGKKTATGGFMMSGKPDITIQIPLFFPDFSEVLLYTEKSIQAYLSYRYGKMFSARDAEYETKEPEKEKPEEEDGAAFGMSSYRPLPY